MSESANLLMIEFLAWISSRRRTYSETMEAWQTTCPRHAVWENALIDDLIQLNRSSTIRDPEVTLTPRGIALLGGETNHVKRFNRVVRSPSASLFYRRSPHRQSASSSVLKAQSSRSGSRIPRITRVKPVFFNIGPPNLRQRLLYRSLGTTVKNENRQ